MTSSGGDDLLGLGFFDDDDFGKCEGVWRGCTMVGWFWSIVLFYCPIVDSLAELKYMRLHYMILGFFIGTFLAELVDFDELDGILCSIEWDRTGESYAIIYLIFSYNFYRAYTKNYVECYIK